MRLSFFAAAVIGVLAVLPGVAYARPGEAIIHPTRTPYEQPEAADSPACDAHFCVHWVASGDDAPPLKDGDGDGVPDYVERVLGIAEHVHQVENEKLGWREPFDDGRRGGDGKTDIYLTELAGEDVFGYTATDPSSGGDRRSAYLVLDNDYSPFEYPGTTQGHDLKVTLAHEYDHVLQYSYAALDVERDPWFAEATAVWMEDQVYNGINDYLRYVRRWVKMWSTPLTEGSIKEYGSAVWNEWLARHYGRSIIREAWEDAAEARPRGFAVAAYEKAIRAAGPSSFGRDFTRFAADVAEWRTGAGFRESSLYPDMPRQGTLVLGTTSTRHLRHTTFSLIRVPATAGSAVEVRLRAPEGVAAGLALVGRIGSERKGRVVRSVAYREEGGELVATLPDPGRFQRITAVVVDADTAIRGWDAARDVWDYRGGAEPFRVGDQIVR
ncbi:MAG: DUF6055 domain-containing protein [Solirubrobacterales bacterium]